VQLHHELSEIFGRAALVERVLDAAGRGRHVSLSGEPGIGVSTVVSEVFSRLAERGDHPTLIRAVAATRSFAALDPLTGGVGASSRFEALVSLLGQRRRPADALPPVVLIDDTQWIDEDSAAVLTQIALGGHARLVLAARAGTNLPDVLRRLASRPTTEHFEVTELATEQSVQLLAHLLPGYIERKTQITLVRTSAGNPSHLQALVHGSVAAGVLAARRDTWRLIGPLRCDPAAAAALYQVTAAFTEAQRDALDTLALVGELRVDLAERVIALDDLEVLERARLLVVSDEASEPVMRLASPLLEVALTSRLGTFFRQRMYRELAEQAAALGRSDEVVALMWHVRGGVPTSAESLMAGAIRARAEQDVATAAELAQAAYAITGEVDAVILAVRSLAGAGSEIEAIAIARQALASATEPFPKAALLHFIRDEAWWIGHDGDDDCGRLVDAAPADLGDWAGLLDAHRAVIDLLGGDLAAVERARDLINHPLAAVRILAGVPIAMMHSLQGNADEGLALSAALLTEAASPDLDRKATLVAQPGIHVLGLISALAHVGRLTEARQFADRIQAVVVEGSGLRVRAFAATMIAQIWSHSGCPSAAESHFAEAEAVWADVGLVPPATWAATGRAWMLAQMGDVEGARSALERATRTNRENFRLMEPFLYLAIAWTAMLEGKVEEANEAATTGVAFARESGATAHLEMMTHSLARLGLREATAHALESTPAADSRSPFALAERGFATAFLDDDPVSLEANGHAWSTMGAPLYAAEAFALAAQLYRTCRKTAEAARADGLVSQMMLTADPARTPILRARQQQTLLTPRLAEVAELARQGLRTGEIAEHLVISQRSVESHMQRIYSRLGVTSRAELALVLDGWSVEPAIG
jgi:DNA-binding CsgD family transcriptional regulator